MMSSHYSHSKKSSGFSLIEIAVVLFIITILTAIVAVPIASQVESRRIEETQKQLEIAKDAIIGFAITNGRLPCPALDDGSICTKGRECFCTESTPSGACTHALSTTLPAYGRCAAFDTSASSSAVLNGFLPAATLGLTPVDTNGYILDAYSTSSNRIYYSVARNTVGPIPFALTATDGIKSATMTNFAGGTSLTVCPTSAISCTLTTSLTSDAPFVLYSLGKNAPITPTSTKELANLDNNTTFVSGDHVDDFDDIVTWASINTVFSRMVQAGKLP